MLKSVHKLHMCVISFVCVAPSTRLRCLAVGIDTNCIHTLLKNDCSITFYQKPCKMAHAYRCYPCKRVYRTSHELDEHFNKRHRSCNLDIVNDPFFQRSSLLHDVHKHPAWIIQGSRDDVPLDHPGIRHEYNVFASGLE